MPDRPTAHPISRLAVVVPACDEESSIGRSLAAIRAAAERVLPAVDVVVVANGCADATAEEARHRGAHVICRAEPNVGAARAAGAQWALRRGTEGLWIATTDADSVVPDHWLVAQLAAAGAGADVFLGTVALEPDDSVRHQNWLDRYARKSELGAAHGHVHGANLGIRATSYAAVDGFRGLPVHEDRDLVARLEEIGARLHWVSDAAVTTSARHDPRATGGVGTDLAASG